MIDYNIYIESDAMISIVWPDRIDVTLNLFISSCAEALAESLGSLIYIIPTYHRISVYYDVLSIQPSILVDKIQEVLMRVPERDATAMDYLRIPVCYEEPFSEDMAELCTHTGLEPKAVIHHHTEPIYHVFMIGFLPGFPYLGGLNEKLQMPRKAVPRNRIEPGAVGIAGAQTGVYPIASPGGWQIIGRTPLSLFDISREKPNLLKAGDRLKFVAIDIETFDAIQGGQMIWEV